MNVQRIVDIIASNKLSKVDIASKMKVSRTTLDNLLNGADVKVLKYRFEELYKECTRRQPKDGVSILILF